MPIESPPTTASGSKLNISDFVICQDFVFRPSNVDGFSHEAYADCSGVTTVNFKSFTQSIRDPDRRLFDYLVSRLNPKSVDEAC